VNPRLSIFKLNNKLPIIMYFFEFTPYMTTSTSKQIISVCGEHKISLLIC